MWLLGSVPCSKTDLQIWMLSIFLLVSFSVSSYFSPCSLITLMATSSQDAPCLIDQVFFLQHWQVYLPVLTLVLQCMQSLLSQSCPLHGFVLWTMSMILVPTFSTTLTTYHVAPRSSSSALILVNGQLITPFISFFLDFYCCSFSSLFLFLEAN